jgi:hypothetical protein
MKKVFLLLFHLILSLMSLLIYSKLAKLELNPTYAILAVVIAIFGVISTKNIVKNVKLYYIIQAIVTVIITVAIYYFFQMFKLID